MRKSLRIAILDLYKGSENQGMRCLRELIDNFGKTNNFDITLDEFEVRASNQIPNLDYDIYISSGGPGSPIEDDGSNWEELYFNWIAAVIDFNKDKNNKFKKNVFFICHSFQLACRFFGIAEVKKRKSTSFGIFPVHFANNEINDNVLRGLSDPFYAVDNRDYQVVNPDYKKMHNSGSTVLAIEKDRPHVNLERAIMAIRFNEHMIGTQFHPEGDVKGMLQYLQSEEKKKIIIENHGEQKWDSMMEQLNDPDKIIMTYAKVIPNFLIQSTKDFINIQ